eukprot:6019902-Lingulodinium_polyedra.AAC.1
MSVPRPLASEYCDARHRICADSSTLERTKAWWCLATPIPNPMLLYAEQASGEPTPLKTSAYLVTFHWE